MSDLSTREQTKVDRYSNPMFWLNLSPQRRDRPRKELSEIENKYSRNIKREIEELINEKFSGLCNTLPFR